MLELVHAISGGMIAYKIGRPLISLPLAILSHFILDLLPHWNPHISKEKKKYGHLTKKTKFIIIIDCLIGLILGVYLAKLSLPDVQKAIIILLGCLMGTLPDLAEAPYYFLNCKNNRFVKKLASFQGSLQWNVPFIWGIISQLVYLLFLFYLL